MDDLSLHIMDIIENSVRAEATEISLVIKVSVTANVLKIDIADNGKGMDKEEMKKCEDPFYSTKERKKTGLGIALLKQSSEEAEGTFLLSSEKGKGTKISATFQYDHIDRRPLGDIAKTFYILIAAYPDVNFLFSYKKDSESFEVDTVSIKEELDDVPINAPDVLKTLRNHIIGGIMSVERQGKDVNNKKILVIDDEAIVRVSCERVLKPEGYHVVVTQKGTDAIGMLEDERFDLVLTDLKMPDMDGLEVLKTIKSKWPDIIVIIITGYGTISTAIQAIKLGAYEYIEKPFTPEDILKAVKKALTERTNDA